MKDVSSAMFEAIDDATHCDLPVCEMSPVIVMSPVILVFPVTSSIRAGLVVPMPTSPVSETVTVAVVEGIIH